MRDDEFNAIRERVYMADFEMQGGHDGATEAERDRRTLLHECERLRAGRGDVAERLERAVASLHRSGRLDDARLAEFGSDLHAMLPALRAALAGQQDALRAPTQPDGELDAALKREKEWSEREVLNGANATYHAGFCAAMNVARNIARDLRPAPEGAERASQLIATDAERERLDLQAIYQRCLDAAMAYAGMDELRRSQRDVWALVREVKRLRAPVAREGTDVEGSPNE